MIVFANVSKVFADGTAAVDRLSLTVPTGKLTVFVGSSGSGKTTALRMINRMIEPRPAPSASTVSTCPPSTRSNCAWASATSSSMPG
ncbi:hypothetical protein MAP_0272 [Mycobacterium avium subsp. paratuberculosis K-10]|uniref:ABC transporter domain-containing protein n=1 Tax=Mycolicibacterium paratuberculosis (strain ATCC BAA-968 / K-10) TaxID=262316 RepID=Q745R6_MYCPA|nr:hypothetical protein MAP_0272 [Mycobacterium avium subsp. paratuberculosis K-10]CAG6922649.1 hypothetical protein PICSAR10_03699 [Mycobacterium avium subsp. paratuberculosis]